MTIGTRRVGQGRMGRLAAGVVVGAGLTGSAVAQSPGVIAPQTVALPGTPAAAPPVPADSPTAPGAVASPGPSVTPFPVIGAQPVAAGPGAAPGSATPAPRLFEAYWDNGLFFRTPGRDFVAHVGGTLQYDAAFYSPGRGVQFNNGGTGRFSDGVNLRRGRLFAEGTFYHDFDYKFELEFFNGFLAAGAGTNATNTNVANTPGPTDANITARNVPFVGNVRIGNQKEWFSLEHLNSYRFLEFLERSYLFDASQATAFNNGFTPGVSVFRTWADDRVFTAAGAYKNESDLIGFGVGDGQYAVTGRVAGLPVWNPAANRFWHVGGAMSHRDPVNGQVQVRIRDDIRNAPFPLLNLIANTGLVNASSQTLFNLETAGTIDSFTFQGEYTQNLIYDASNATVPNAGTLAYQGFYAEGMYFLTGESRTWDNKNYIFRRVIPKNNFGFTKGALRPDGWGAVELAARYQYLNLNSQGINGGRLNAVTLGLNWYWNPNAKLQFNYDYTYRDGVNPASQGAIHSAGTRMQYDF